MKPADLEFLDAFNPISLEEITGAKLYDRIDTKFLFRLDLLPGILKELQPFYRIMNVNHTRISRYETCYYDTPDFAFYRQHHNGKLNRWKVRTRKYVNSDQCYFELKFKNNKDRTVKDRIEIHETDDPIHGASKRLLLQQTPFEPGMLQPVLTVLYDRITLVNNSLTERLTIDTRLSFRAAGEECSFPMIAIAEIKQEKASRSQFLSVMHQYHIRKQAISKYCIGIASIFREIKKNNFKVKLRHINQLNHAQFKDLHYNSLPVNSGFSR